ncbi:DUF3892 domain-containing protein [Streptomyces sp. GD-15H]|uniref:DUF3892 domain-containing protein n=1 Tax=Streptomyces sp. GD-15H TaxID=3129112 RepID=UPI003246ACDC
MGVEDLPGSETFTRLTPDRLTRRWWEQDTPGPEERPAPVVPSIRFVGAAMPTRLFVTTTDGRVMSRFTSSQGTVSWTDHGTPPGTTAESAPAGVRDLHAFVTGADGRLYRLGWDGDRFAWHNHGHPASGILSRWWRLSAVARNSRPSGSLMQTGTYDSVYAVNTAGQLVELKTYNGETWTWSQIGTPNGANVPNPPPRLHGSPFVLAPLKLSAVGENGRMYFYSWDAGWKWQELGKPDNGVFAADMPPVPGPGLLSYMIKGHPDQLFTYQFSGGLFPLPGWKSFRTDVGICLGAIGTNRGVVSSNYSSLLIHTNGSGWAEVGGRAPVSGNQALRGVLQGSVVWAVGDGRLLRLDTAAANPRWEDLGRPAFGGAGTPGAVPARHIRWRPRLGFRSNLLVGHVDNPGGPNKAYLRIGRNTDFDAKVTGGWQAPQQLPLYGFNDNVQGFAIACTDLNVPDPANPRPDLLVFWIQDHPLGNFGNYVFGRDLSSTGTPANWTEPQQLPVPMSTLYGSSGALTASYPVECGTATLADLDGDNRQELIVVYAAGTPGNRRLFLRIGWALDPESGKVTGGWTDSVEIPWPGRPSNTAPPIAGMAVAVADLDGDLRPELVVLLMEQTASGVTASYRIGWNINARGTVTGRAGGEKWSSLRSVPGGFGAKVCGAGLSVADFSGSQQPDLLVLAVEDVEGASQENRAWYRVGTDADHGTPRKWSDLIPAHPGGWYGWYNQGAAVCVADLPGDTLARKRRIAENFRTAATRHQNGLLAAQHRAEQEDEAALRLSGLAEAVHEALAPERTVTRRITARLGGAGLAEADLTDPLNPLLTPPVFTHPMAELLTELGQDHLLPGVQEIPADTVTLLRTNPAFVEAFLTGANHELGRELLWRGFPTDRSATSFRHFWDARGTVPPGEEEPDVPPLAEWPRRARLGTVAVGPSGGEELVLLVRGELVRRFASLGLHARRALPPDTPGGPRRLGDERLEPVFFGRLDPDILYAGFPITAAEARGDDAAEGSEGGDPGWYLVFEEHPTAPRFGLDVPSRDAAHGALPPTWRDISWASVVPDADALDALTHAPLTTPFGAPSRPLRTPRHAGETVPEVTWAYNAAHLAHITLQQPARVAFHATDLLPGFGAGRRVTHVRKREPGSDVVRVRELAGQHPDGTWWRFTTAQVIAAIQARESFCVEPAPGQRVAVRVVRRSDGRPYLRTEDNDTTGDNLLSLPPIPPGAGLPPQYAEPAAATGAAAPTTTSRTPLDGHV